MSQRASIVTTSTLTSSDLDSVYEFREDCRQVLCSSSLSTERGKIQKTCQLIWYPLLPAVALLVYSTVYLVQDAQDYIKKVGHLHDSKDIEAAASCLESIRRIQTLRYTSTLYLSSGSPVHSFELFVDAAFSSTAEALSEAEAPNQDPNQPCTFPHLVKEYFSEMNFGQTDIDIDDDSTKNFCTLRDFTLASLGQMQNLTVTFQKEAVRRVSSTFSFLIDLMIVDCMKNVAYYGNCLDIIQSVDRYHALVDLEKTYSKMLAVGSVYFSRGYLEKSERRAMLANLRLADDYDRFNQLNVEVPEMVRTITAEVTNAGNEHGRSTATSFGLVRWSETMQAFVSFLDGLVNDELAEMQRRTDAKRLTIGWRVGFGVFAWLAVFAALLPVVTVNATRAMSTIRIYSQSFASKELELRREKHKTEALLNEMLPRSELHHNISFYHMICGALCGSGKSK